MKKFQIAKKSGIKVYMYTMLWFQEPDKNDNIINVKTLTVPIFLTAGIFFLIKADMKVLKQILEFHIL